MALMSCPIRLRKKVLDLTNIHFTRDRHTEDFTPKNELKANYYDRYPTSEQRVPSYAVKCITIGPFSTRKLPVKGADLHEPRPDQTI